MQSATNYATPYDTCTKRGYPFRAHAQTRSMEAYAGTRAASMRTQANRPDINRE